MIPNNPKWDLLGNNAVSLEYEKFDTIIDVIIEDEIPQCRLQQ